jgi:hypothetical protein
MANTPAMQTTAPWMLRAWPTLLWQADSTAELHFVHLGTRVLTHDKSLPSAGQTMWVGPLPDGDAGVAWDWVQIGRGVVAMADPMSVVTNLRLVGPEGEELTELEAVRYLNVLVHGLPWQDEVCRLLGTD